MYYINTIITYGIGDAREGCRGRGRHLGIVAVGAALLAQVRVEVLLPVFACERVLSCRCMSVREWELKSSSLVSVRVSDVIMCMYVCVREKGTIIVLTRTS